MENLVAKYARSHLLRGLGKKGARLQFDNTKQRPSLHHVLRGIDVSENFPGHNYPCLHQVMLIERALVSLHINSSAPNLHMLSFSFLSRYSLHSHGSRISHRHRRTRSNLCTPRSPPPRTPRSQRQQAHSHWSLLRGSYELEGGCLFQQWPVWSLCSCISE